MEGHGDDEEAPLVVDNLAPLNHNRDVYILSTAFLLIFLAYGAAQNLESTINTVLLIAFSIFNWKDFNFVYNK